MWCRDELLWCQFKYLSKLAIAWLIKYSVNPSLIKRYGHTHQQLALVLLAEIDQVKLFWYMLDCGVYVTSPKQFEPWKIPTVMNGQCCLILELLLYKFKIGYNAVETTKNVCCVNGVDEVNQSTVTRWLKKFCLGCKVRLP